MAIEKNKENSTLKKPKHPWWRPSKMPNFVKAMEKVLSAEMNAIIMTDEELFILANEELPKEEQVCYASFKNYKSSMKDEEKALQSEFLAVYKKALLKQKNELFKNMSKDNPQWQKFAWIIERKFSDWNLRVITENTNNNHNTNVHLHKNVEDMSDDELNTYL